MENHGEEVGDSRENVMESLNSWTEKGILENTYFILFRDQKRED